MWDESHSSALPPYVFAGREPEPPKTGGVKRSKTKVRPVRRYEPLHFENMIAPRRGIVDTACLEERSPLTPTTVPLSTPPSACSLSDPLLTVASSGGTDPLAEGQRHERVHRCRHCRFLDWHDPAQPQPQQPQRR